MPYDIIGAVKKQFFLIKQLENRIKREQDGQLQLSVEIMKLCREQSNYQALIGDLMIKIEKLTKRLEALECHRKESSE